MAAFFKLSALYNIKILFLLIFYYSLSFSSFGQNPFQLYLTEDTKSFSRSAAELSEQFDQYGKTSRSPIKRLELRSETRDFNLNQQEYSLRLSFNDFYFNNYNRQILSNELLLINAETKNIKNKALENKYRDILEYIIVSEELNIELSKLESIKALDKLYQLLIQNGQIELDDVTANQLDAIKIQANIFSLKEQMSAYRTLFWKQDSNDVIVHSLPEPISIIQFIDSSKSLDSPLDQINLIKEDLLQTKYKQKAASENQILDFLQARYVSDPEDLLKEKLSIGIGLRIPYVNNNSYNHTKLHQSLFELHIEQHLKLQELDYDLQQIKRKIKTKYTQLSALDHGLQKLTQWSHSADSTEFKISDGIKWVKMNIEVDKFKLSILDLKREFYKEYLNFLSKAAYINVDYPYYLLHLPFTRL